MQATAPGIRRRGGAGAGSDAPRSCTAARSAASGTGRRGVREGVERGPRRGRTSRHLLGSAHRRTQRGETARGMHLHRAREQPSAPPRRPRAGRRGSAARGPPAGASTTSRARGAGRRAARRVPAWCGRAWPRRVVGRVVAPGAPPAVDRDVAGDPHDPRLGVAAHLAPVHEGTGEGLLRHVLRLTATAEELEAHAVGRVRRARRTTPRRRGRSPGSPAACASRSRARAADSAHLVRSCDHGALCLQCHTHVENTLERRGRLTCSGEFPRRA